MKLKTKIKRNHRQGCRALIHVKNKDWSTPWAFFEEQVLWRDSRGGNRGSGHRWLRLICNTTDCPGQIWVREAELVDLLPHQ